MHNIIVSFITLVKNLSVTRRSYKVSYIISNVWRNWLAKHREYNSRLNTTVIGTSRAVTWKPVFTIREPKQFISSTSEPMPARNFNDPRGRASPCPTNERPRALKLPPQRYLLMYSSWEPCGTFPRPYKNHGHSVWTRPIISSTKRVFNSAKAVEERGLDPYRDTRGPRSIHLLSRQHVADFPRVPPPPSAPRGWGWG